MASLELHEACSLGDVSALRAQLRCDDVDVNLKDVDWKRRAPLHWACARGHIECIRLLLDHGADGTIRMTMGWTPAHCSCEAGKLAALRALHAYGVPLDRRDKYGDTPRRIAQIYGHADCVSFIDKAEQQQTERRDRPRRGRAVSASSTVSNFSDSDDETCDK